MSALRQSQDLRKSSELHFENEYSRLIGTLGKEALLKLQSSKVLLVGLGGLGVEVGVCSFLSPLPSARAAFAFVYFTLSTNS